MEVCVDVADASLVKKPECEEDRTDYEKLKGLVQRRVENRIK